MLPNFNLKARAHAYYMQNHFQVFQNMHDVAATWNECFHEWNAKAKSSVIVDLAFSSLALSIFAQTQSCTPAATEACQTYLLLLQRMQDRVLHISDGNVEADEIDAHLLAAYFMARYESSRHHGTDEESRRLTSTKVWLHFNGAAAILRSWYNHRLAYTPTTTIKQTRRLLMTSCLLREQPLPRWLADGAVFGEQDIALGFDRLIVQIIDFRNKYLELKQISEHGDPIVPDVSGLLSNLRKLDHDLHIWSTRLPSKWSYQEHTLPETCDYLHDDFFSPVVFSCGRLGYAAVWNSYYAIRMVLADTRLRVLDLVVPLTNMGDQSETLECLAQLISSAWCLASLIPFSLERIRRLPHLMPGTTVGTSNEPLKPYLANLVVWPLSIAVGLEKLEPERQQWFHAKLFQVSSASSECLISYAMSDLWNV